MFGQNFVHILVHSEQSLGKLHSKLRSKLRSKLHSKLRSKLHLKLRSKLHSNLGWPGLSKLVLVAPKTYPHPDIDALAAGATDLIKPGVRTK